MSNLNVVRARLAKRFEKIEARKNNRLEKAVLFLEAAYKACRDGDDGSCSAILESMTCSCGGTCDRCSRESKKPEWGMADGGSGYEGDGSNQYKKKGKSKFAPAEHEPDEPIRVESPKQRSERIRSMKVDPARAKVIKRALGQKAVEAILLKAKAKRHDVPERSFVDDVRRKLKIRKVMKRQSVGASGEISGLLRGAEKIEAEMLMNSEAEERLNAALEQNGYSFAGRPVGTGRGDGLYEADQADQADPGDSESDKVRANYRYASDPARSCGECRHFVEPAGCELVAGMIQKTDTCDWFEKGEGSMRESDRIKVSDAVAAFRVEYNSPFTEAERKIEALKARYAKELRLARNAKERREAEARYKAAVRRETEGYRPLPGKVNPGDHRRDSDAGDE